MWTIAAVCLAPFVASFAIYFLWPPAGRVNYGELLTGVEIPVEKLELVDGTPFDFGELHGKWIFVTVDSGGCDEYCRGKLWKMRQVRRTQGKNMERIERVWLVTDGPRPGAELLKEHQGTKVVRADGTRTLGALPFDGAQRDHIYLVDPLGNVVLRYPREADPNRIKKDISRLLRVSRVG